MSLFKPNRLPAGLAVTDLAWRPLEPGQRPAPVPPSQAAAATPAVPAEQDLLARARNQAADILQQAAAEAEAAVAEARTAGFAEGKAEGLAAGRAELEQQRQRADWELEKAQLQAQATLAQAEGDARVLRSQAEVEVQAMLSRAREEAATLVEAGRQEQRQLLDDAHGALVELAIAAAERLVQAHLAVQPAAIAAMVAAGLRRLKETDCTVRANPQNLPLLHAQRSALERELGSGALKLVPDPGLTPGGFTIQSGHGFIDGSLEQQSAQLRSAMTAALGGD